MDTKVAEKSPSGPGTEPERLEKYGWGRRHLQITLLFLALTITYLFRTNLSVCIVEMSKELSWDKSQQGLILSSFFWGYILMQVPAGILATRFGAKWFMFGGLTVCSVMSLLTPLAARVGPGLVVALRVVQGLSQGVVYPCAHTMLSRWAPPSERETLSALVYNGLSVGTVISMAGSGLLANSPLGWPSGFWVPGIIGLVWALGWFFLADSAPSSCKRMDPREREYIEAGFGDSSSGEKRLPVPWLSIMTSLPMWALIVVHMGQNFGHWVLLTEMPTYLEEALGFSIADNGIRSALPYLTLAITSWMAGFIAPYVNRYVSINTSRKGFQSMAHWGSGVMMLLLGLLTVSETGAVVLLCAAVGFEAGTMVGYLCNHMDLSPNFGGAMMGVTNMMATIIAIIAPIIASAITGDSEGKTKEEMVGRWQIVFILAAAVYFGGNLFWVVFGSTKTQPWNNPPDQAVLSLANEEEQTAIPEKVAPNNTKVPSEDFSQDRKV